MSRSADLDVVGEAWLSLKNILSNYDIADIYNTDEFGLFYCLGPLRTLAAKNDKAKGGKNNKKRITVLLNSNASGTVKIKQKRFACIKFSLKIHIGSNKILN